MMQLFLHKSEVEDLMGFSQLNIRKMTFAVKIAFDKSLKVK